MAVNQNIRRAARVLLDGGVIAYPTEGVYGLGCLPDDVDAVARILEMKRRDVDMGLILIAADLEQLDGWANLPGDVELPSSDDQPVTWIVPADDAAPGWITGKHSGIAVRMTTHPVARALCAAVDSPLVSTSANVSGRPVVPNAHVLRREFGALVDYVVPGELGGAGNASEIRVLDTGATVRSA